jgi:porin
MKLKWKLPVRYLLTLMLLVFLIKPGIADESKTTEVDEASAYPQFGGPDSVSGQLTDDTRTKDTLTEFKLFPGYYDWKDDLRKDHGFSYTIDYSAGFVGATDTQNHEDLFSGGAVRAFGSWDLIGRESGNTGTFIWKVENRHKYSNIPPNGTASQVGYAGVTMPNFSNIRSRLTNLFWKQNLMKGRMEVIAGMIDTTDWIDIYALASPWTGFFNFVFATGGASIPVPDDAALGAYVNAMITDNIYVIGGFADSNSDSTDPFNGFDTFFDDNEYFKTIELGWTTAQDRFYLDNTHITFWHTDKRDKADVSSGWGASFSFAYAFKDKWMPFVRAGYANDGGSILQGTVSTGLGYHLKDDVSLFGFGLNWGQPNNDTFGSGLEDQYTIEVFCRLQVTQNIQITPDIQYMINPALDPDEDNSWVFGLRARIAL